MTENPKKDGDLVFLGINFNNFFKDCSCFKRVMAEDGEIDSVSSNEDLPMDLISRYQNCRPEPEQIHLQVPQPTLNFDPTKETTTTALAVQVLTGLILKRCLFKQKIQLFGLLQQTIKIKLL